MKLSAARLALAVLPCIALGCGGAEGPLGPSANRAPVIRSFAITPKDVLVGGTARVEVDAFDPDGDTLFYSYAVDAGSITKEADNPARATYTASTDRESATITVIVVDAWNAAAATRQSIRLQGNRAPDVAISGGGSCHPPCRLTFSATAQDLDGDAVKLTWSGCASGEGPEIACNVAGVGTITAVVTASDGRGGVTTQTASGEGENRPPAVSGGRDVHGQSAQFSARAHDPDGDRFNCGWLGDCNCTGVPPPYTLDCRTLGAASCQMELTCTDEFGASAGTIFRLLP